MKSLIAVCLACAAWTCGGALAQSAGAAAPRDPIAEQVLPPELILRHHKAIRLADAQRNAVLGEVKRAQGQMTDLQWDMQRAVERMVELLGQDRVDEQQALAQLDKVLAVEREVKRTHVGLAARLKNILTPEQQRLLRELRSSAPEAGDTAPRR